MAMLAHLAGVLSECMVVLDLAVGTKRVKIF